MFIQYDYNRHFWDEYGQMCKTFIYLNKIFVDKCLIIFGQNLVFPAIVPL